MINLCACYHWVVNWMRLAFCAPVLFGVRIWIASIFGGSGLSKIRDFDATVALFDEVYNLPVIPPFFAAILATSAELVFPVLLVLGLFTELSAAALLVMTIVIQVLVFSHWDHMQWALFLGVLITQGAGMFSVDWLLRKWCARS